MPSRRFVLAGSLSALAAGRLAAQPAADSFAGSRAGAERDIAGIRFCWCPPGSFLMGSPVTEPFRRDNENQVPVTLTRGFWMGKHEVTQGEWRRVFGGVPGPLIAGEGDNFPVYFISYIDAQNLCRALTDMARAAGTLPPPWRFDLPTEAQWEYAARAGTTSAYATGNGITPEQANFGRPYSGRANGVPGQVASAVGSYPPNGWGLHDMAGNEFEWCRDWYHARLPGGTDPDLSAVRGTPNRDGSYSRARRGGAWMDGPQWMRSAVRIPYEPERNADHIGMRLAVVRDGA
jgi:formylglycine-generating enzyme required for sulfatase activity